MIDKTRRNFLLAARKLFETAAHPHRGIVPFDAPPIISVHIPKTAGTSFSAFLRKVYGLRLHYDYGPDTALTSRLIRRAVYTVLRDDDMLRLAYQRKRLGCIHGHFPPKTYAGVFPQANFVCWLRNPVDRVISLYNEQSRYADPNNPDHNAVQEGLSLLEFAGLDKNRDTQHRIIAGVDFAFFGLVERYEDSLDRFILQFRLPVQRPRQVAARNRAGSPAIVDSATRAAIADLNAKELALYEKVSAGMV